MHADIRPSMNRPYAGWDPAVQNSRDVDWEEIDCQWHGDRNARPIFRRLVIFARTQGSSATTRELWEASIFLARLAEVTQSYRPPSRERTLLKSVRVAEQLLMNRKIFGQTMRMPTGGLARFSRFRSFNDRFPHAYDGLPARSPMEEVENLARKAQHAILRLDSLPMERALREMSPYSCELLCNYARDPQVLEGDAWRILMLAAGAWLFEPRLRSRPRMPMHDQLVHHIQIVAEVYTGRSPKAATVRRVASSSKEGVATERGGDIHRLVMDIGQIVGIPLVSKSSDDRMRKPRK